MSLPPFHIAIPVHSLTAAQRFYGELLGCPQGRSSSNWIDFDFFGHQFVCHQAAVPIAIKARNEVDGERVPVPHCGVVLEWAEWERLAERLSEQKADFVIEPGVRFAGEPGEQATMFVADPSGNVLEFKAMRNPDNLFAE